MNILNKKKNYLKKISKIFPEVEMHSLEIFNQRNDKIDLFNKIFYFDLIKRTIKKNKYKNIKVFSNNKDSKKFYESLNPNKRIVKLDIINTKSNKKRKKLNFELSFLNFAFKALVTIIFSKIFSRNISKNYKNGCLSLFPIFFSQQKYENFFDTKYLKLNFLITDETHLNGTILENLKKIFLLRKIDDLIIVEKYITLTHFISFFFKSFSILKKINLINKINFKFHGLDLTDEINNYLKISLFNAIKLQIYKSQLSQIFFKYKIKNFHYYMFEYNFGFFLSNEIKKNFKYIKLIGYQHGIFSEKLMWLDLFKKKTKKLRIFPHKIVVKYQQSLQDYKKIFVNKEVVLKKNYPSNIDIKISNQKKYQNKVLVLLGLHDSVDMINNLIKIVRLKNNYIFFIKFHPKNKNEFKLNIKHIKLINNIHNIKFGHIILSQTSTLVYDMINSKKAFKLIKMTNKINLLANNIHEKIKYIN